jgi:PAS domain S-box-containing protein
MVESARDESDKPIYNEIHRFFDLSPDLFAIVGFDGYLKRINPAWEHLLGYTAEELLSRPSIEFVHPDDRDRISLSRQRVRDAEMIAKLEVRYICKDGSIKWLEWTAHSYPDEHLIYGVGRDITQRKQTEQKLSNSEEQFRSVLESASEGIVLADQSGAILLVNRRAEELFGYSRDELFSRSVDVLMPEANREQHAHYRQVYTKHPGVRHMGTGRELVAQRKDGTIFPAEVSLSFIQSERDSMLVLAFVTDITERKQLEQARLDHQRLQLELQQEQQMVELRQRFMSMVSHEFRTPLTVIASSSEMLQHYYDRMPREKQMEKLQIINAQVREMVGLLDDILALNKIQAGIGEFAPEAIDLATTCQQILENIRLIDQDQHQFILNKHDVPVTIQADRRLLEHIITNLLSNAIKYSPAGSSIYLSLSGGEKDVQLEIRDEGIGIPEEDSPHLFEPFYRAGNARKINGTGLGLAIVKNNVERHGGTITFHSVEGQGTTFTIRLPVSVYA